MAITEAFIVRCERETMILAPTRNIASLTEEDVKQQWDSIVQQIDEPGLKHVVFDFQHVKYFGSSMLEAMLFLWKRIRQDSGKMAVCNITDTAGEILRLSKFDTIWPVFSTCDQALDYVTG